MSKMDSTTEVPNPRLKGCWYCYFAHGEFGGDCDCWKGQTYCRKLQRILDRDYYDNKDNITHDLVVIAQICPFFTLEEEMEVNKR